MNGSQSERLNRRMRRHRLRFWRGAVFALGLCVLAWWASPDPYRRNPLPIVGPGVFVEMRDWFVFWGRADGRFSLGWLWELHGPFGWFTHPRISIGWADLRPFRWALLPVAVIVLLGRWRALHSWSSLSLRHTRAGFCASCGYDRSGLGTGAVCPECGSAANV